MTDEKKARRVIDFIQCLRHTKGEFHGKPFKLLPWQEKIIRDVFGTVREDDPTIRQYTTAYIEIPKKQGKALALSTLLPTPQGWKQMEDIRVGDQVFDEGGRPCMSSSVCNCTFLDVILNMMLLAILNHFCSFVIIKLSVLGISTCFFAVIGAPKDNLVHEVYCIQ